MKKTQLNKGMKRRVMYVENKDKGMIAHIGWVTFSKSGETVYYKDKALKKSKSLIRGNFFDTETGEEYWVSGIKKKGSNTHYAPVRVIVDDDAVAEYKKIKGAPIKKPKSGK